MFENKTAIVTGASKGIGYGIALALAQNGARVVLADIDTETNNRSCEEIVQISKSQCIAVTCDVSKKEDIQNLIKTTKNELGSVDILVNNAGIYPFKPFMDLTEEDWDTIMDVNLKSMFMASQEAAKEMKEGGKIVNISSIASLVGFEGLTHYCATKGGANGMTRAMALELAHKKINVNAVAPGAIETPGASGAISGDALKQTLSQIPWARVGLPEDIANAVVFLASDKSDYITGQVIVVDGGWTLR